MSILACRFKISVVAVLIKKKKRILNSAAHAIRRNANQIVAVPGAEESSFSPTDWAKPARSNCRDTISSGGHCEADASSCIRNSRLFCSRPSCAQNVGATILWNHHRDGYRSQRGRGSECGRKSDEHRYKRHCRFKNERRGRVCRQ